MAHFTPCDHDSPHKECYRCAVKLVLWELGWDPYCQCLGGGKSFCGTKCGEIRADWAIAFAMTDTGERELAFQRLNSRGITLQRFLILDGEQESDITNEVLAGAVPDPDKSHFALHKQDVQKAAIELASEVGTDPISYDAALYLAAEQIRLGNSVPEALRGWAADVFSGIVKRPRQVGKHREATLFRDRLIVKLIRYVIEKTELKPTSGERERGASACNAVAQGLGLLRIQPDSYESMVKIWGRREEPTFVSIPERV